MDRTGKTIQVVPIAAEHVEGFHGCLDAVARERRWLGFVEAPPLENVRSFVRGNIANDLPQFVAMDGTRVVGWCDVSPKRLAGFTHCGQLGMGVLAEYRGLGIGERLARAVLAKTRSIGLERVELEVYASNLPAIGLYRKLGFQVEGTLRHGRKLDGRYEDVVIMALLVEAPDSPAAQEATSS